MPVHIEYFYQTPFQLSTEDRDRANEDAKQIQRDLIALSQGASVFKSSRGYDSVRLGSYKHKYCQDIIG